MAFFLPPPGPALFGLIERAVNAVLASDPATLQRLGAHAGRSIGIAAVDTGIELVMHLETGRVRISAPAGQSADCTLQAASVVFMQLAMQPGNRALLFGNRMQVTGDTALAGEIADCLGDLEIDTGALLAPLLGDVAGQGLGQLLDLATGWARRTGDHLRMDLTEYLENESGLPSATEGRQLFGEIDDTRDAVERLEQRLQRLAARLYPQEETT